MKILLTLFVLFFSSSVLAETYKCLLNYNDGYSDQKSYEVIIVIHEGTDAGPIVLLDKNNSFKQIIVPGIQTIGKVHSNDYPFAGGKISSDAYFTTISPWSIQGFFVNGINFIPFQIDIKQLNPEKILIWIHDPTHIIFSENNSNGECK